MFVDTSTSDDLLESIISSCEQIHKQLDRLTLNLNSKSVVDDVVIYSGSTLVCSIHNFFLEELYFIQQTSSVSEFHQRFESVRTLIGYTQFGISETFYASLFVNGLRKEVQTYVQSFLPSTVLDAFELGCIYEYNFSLASTVNTSDVNVVDNISTATSSSPVEGSSYASIVPVVVSSVAAISPMPQLQGMKSEQQLVKAPYMHSENRSTKSEKARIVQPIKEQYNVDSKQDVSLYSTARIEQFTKTEEAYSVGIGQWAALLGISEEDSVTYRFRGSSGWPPPPQVSPCPCAPLCMQHVLVDTKTTPYVVLVGTPNLIRGKLGTAVALLTQGPLSLMWSSIKFIQNSIDTNVANFSVDNGDAATISASRDHVNNNLAFSRTILVASGYVIWQSQKSPTITKHAGQGTVLHFCNAQSSDQLTVSIFCFLTSRLISKGEDDSTSHMTSHYCPMELSVMCFDWGGVDLMVSRSSYPDCVVFLGHSGDNTAVHHGASDSKWVVTVPSNAVNAAVSFAGSFLHSMHTVASISSVDGAAQNSFILVIGVSNDQCICDNAMDSFGEPIWSVAMGIPFVLTNVSEDNSSCFGTKESVLSQPSPASAPSSTSTLQAAKI